MGYSCILYILYFVHSPCLQGPSGNINNLLNLLKFPEMAKVVTVVVSIVVVFDILVSNPRTGQGTRERMAKTVKTMENSGKQ